MLYQLKKKNTNQEMNPLSEPMVHFDETLPDTYPFHIVSRQNNGDARTQKKSLTLPKWLKATFLVFSYILAVSFFYFLGWIEKRSLMLILGTSLFFYFLFMSAFKFEWHLRFRERRLKFLILISMLGTMLFMYYLEPVTHIIFVPFSLISFAYGMYRLSPVKMYSLVAISLGSYLAIIYIHFSRTTNPALFSLELMHFVVLCLALPCFIFLISKVHHLHHILHQASRKIKDIQEDAKKDVLIDCFNRRYMVASLEEQKILADRSGTTFCLAVLDLDHFKRINDVLGHLGGDDVLKKFSLISKENIRIDDIFGRYGGEEFLLIFPEMRLLQSLNTCERIRSQVEEASWGKSNKTEVTVSIGVTQYVPGESVLELFSRADTAMYLAKEGGRNQVVVQEPYNSRAM
jgi:diguanylate cyclase (GGDEF)-like protein